MYPLIALRLVKARNQEMERQASLERLVRSASGDRRRDVTSAAMAASRPSATPPAPTTSAIPWRAI